MFPQINNNRIDLTHPTALAYLVKVLPHKNFETEFHTPAGNMDYIAQLKNGKLMIYEVKTADDKRSLDEFINKIKDYTKYAKNLSKSWGAYLVGTGKFLGSSKRIANIAESLPNSIGLAGLYFSEKKNELPIFMVIKKSKGYKAVSKKQILKNAVNNSWNEQFSLQEVRELKFYYGREL